MKKNCSIYIIIYIILLSNVVAQEDTNSLQNLENDTLVKDVQKLQEFTEESKWDYLKDQWKNLLLKNKYIASVDEFFRKVDLIFVFLFGENYDLSASLFISIMLWLFFLLNFIRIFTTYIAFSKGIGIIIAIGFNIMAAQTGIFRGIANLVFKAIFFKEGIWRWISLLIFLFILAFFYVLIGIILKGIREKRKAKAELEQKLNQKVLGKTVREVVEAYGGP